MPSFAFVAALVLFFMPAVDFFMVVVLARHL